MSSQYDHPTLFDVRPYLRPPPSVQDAPPGYLYAVLMPSHAIKIGWTGRTTATRARELHGALLAWQSGTLVDEAAAHQALAPWRIGRTEDFWPSPAVWRFIAAMHPVAA